MQKNKFYFRRNKGMIHLILGEKGTGKTKVLLEKVEEGVAKTNGNVVYIDNCDQHAFKLSHQVRLVNALQYDISSHDDFHGFIAGIMAGNYDITHIYIDSILKIVGDDYNEFAAMLDRLNKISDGIDIYFVVSADPEELPESLSKYSE